MRFSQVNWVPSLFIIGYHLLWIVALPLYLFSHTPSIAIILLSIALIYIIGMCVTAGYHRLYSHTAYKINPVAEVVLLFFSTMAAQGSVLRWSFDHRHHHAFVDTDRDPYSINKGFWYAHCFWILEKPKPIDNKVISDLVKRPILRFQHRFYGSLFFLTNLILSLFVGWCFKDYLQAFLFVWLGRMFFLHHFTWFINSLAHTWGAQQFSKEHTAVDNYMISLVTFGEGYHNYHHTFAGDYRNGTRWFHFDPTKWLIWVLAKLGLASNLRKVSDTVIQEKILLSQKQELLERFKTSPTPCQASWEEKITNLSENLLVKLREVGKLKEKHAQLLKEKQKEHLSPLLQEMKEMKKNFDKQVKDWMALARDVEAITS